MHSGVIDTHIPVDYPGLIIQTRIHSPVVINLDREWQANKEECGDWSFYRLILMICRELEGMWTRVWNAWFNLVPVLLTLEQENVTGEEVN